MKTYQFSQYTFSVAVSSSLKMSKEKKNILCEIQYTKCVSKELVQRKEIMSETNKKKVVWSSEEKSSELPENNEMMNIKLH